MSISKQFAKLFKKLEKDIETGIEKNNKKLALKVKEKIKARTKDGLDAEEKPFKPLKDSTINKRKKNKNLSKDTKPEFSNQIESGRMVNNMRIKNNDAGFEIRPVSDRADIAYYNEKLGRTVFAISDADVAEIIEDTEKAIDKVLKDL